MNYQLIMLPNPILVSDEEIKEGWFYHPNGSIFPVTPAYLKGPISSGIMKKVIAGIPELPLLDLSLVSDEIGHIDTNIVFEKANAAMNGGKDLPNGILEYRAAAVDFAYGKYLEGYLEGFNANPKKYTEEDMIRAIEMAQEESWDEGGYLGLEHTPDEILKLLKQPKVYAVEVDMEYDYEEHPELVGNPKETWSYPKITNNTIKVTKII